MDIMSCWVCTHKLGASKFNDFEVECRMHLRDFTDSLNLFKADTIQAT
jgi:hypothetical protein